MKICVISSSVLVTPPSGYSGLEYIAYQIATGLAARGHSVVLIAPDGSYAPGCDVIHVGPPGQWDETKSYDKYWKFLPIFDTILDHSWQKHAYMLKAEGKLNSPVLGVLHAPANTMYQQLPPVPKPCLVCISHDQATHLHALFNYRAKVAYNGFDPEFYKSIGIPRTKRFLFLARFSSIKGADLAIQACKEAGVELDLVGDTSITGEPEFYHKVSKMADGKQIKIHGGCSRGETVYWYSQAHVMIHPNMRYREPFGLAPVEAQACGLPVIAWDSGAMRETICREEDKVTGSIVSSFEHLVVAIKSWRDALTPEMRQRCREWALKFSVDNMVSRYEELCFKAVKTGGW